MIKFEKAEVMNISAAIRGMRNPLNSWDKSDSGLCSVWYCDEKCPHAITCCDKFKPDDFIIGKKDLALAQKLIKAGSDHRKFMRQIFASVDITAPLYWWKEFDTYKVGTVANSCSTMHTLHTRDLTLDDFSHDQLFDGINLIEDENNEMEYYENPTLYLECIIKVINHYRKKYVETKDKRFWYQMIQLLPTSYNQMRTVTFSYENLRNIYGSRRNHKLDEWSVGFMAFIDSLPYADELIKVGIKE